MEKKEVKKKKASLLFLSHTGYKTPGEIFSSDRSDMFSHMETALKSWHVYIMTCYSLRRLSHRQRPGSGSGFGLRDKPCVTETVGLAKSWDAILKSGLANVYESRPSLCPASINNKKSLAFSFFSKIFHWGILTYFSAPHRCKECLFDLLYTSCPARAFKSKELKENQM